MLNFFQCLAVSPVCGVWVMYSNGINQFWKSKGRGGNQAGMEESPSRHAIYSIEVPEISIIFIPGELTNFMAANSSDESIRENKII